MAELTWDEQMALSRAREAERRYQNRATHYQGREVASPAPSGGPRRSQPGGGNPKNKEEKNQAKQVRSQIFDLHGITETQINTDPDGTVTEVKKKTPSSVFDDEPFYSEARESARSSIAIPPAAPVVDPEQQRLGKLYQEQRELAGVRDLGVRFGNEPYNVSPHFSFKEGRYLLNQEFDGKPADHWESAPINKTVVLNEKTGELEVQSEPDPVVNDTGLVSATDNDLYLAQDLARLEADQRDLLELKGRHPDLFAQMISEGGFESRPDPHPHAGEGFIENEEGEIVPVAEVASELEDNLDVDGDGDGKNEEANNKLKYDSINTLAKEDPEKIKVLNSFATWAADVSDAESLRAAEDYLENLRNEPTVHDRVKKAMAIAFAAMLFGDDLTTAMNTGFGVVADDYTAEALAAKEAADAQAELEKTMAKEQRDFAYKTLGSERDAAEALHLEAYKQGFQSEKERKAAEIALRNKNTEKATEIINSIKDSLKDHRNYDNIASAEMMGEMNGFLRVLDGQMKALDKQLDLTDWGQREAMSAVLKKWMQERLTLGKAAAPMSAYAQEMFVKSEAQEHIDIDPNLIAPSRDFLLSGDLMTGVDSKKYGTEKQSLRISKDVLDAKHFGTREGTEAVMELGETIQLIAEKGLGEENTLKLLYKDFLDYRQRSLEDKKHPGKIYNDLERIAYEKGWGPFTHFVNVVLEEIGPTALDENLGMNYDSALQGESKEISTAAIISYLESGIYDLEAIKEQLKK
jgi:hypothetical protein